MNHRNHLNNDPGNNAPDSKPSASMLRLTMVCKKDVREIDEHNDAVYSAACNIEMQHSTQREFGALIINCAQTPFFSLGERYVVTVERESDNLARLKKLNGSDLQQDASE